MEQQTPTNFLAVRETGIEGGEALVLLHGFGGSGHSFDPVIDRIGAYTQLILPDLPGQGRSCGVAGPRHSRAAAFAVLETLDNMGCERFHLCGFSMGGAVACLVALQAPDRVKSLTLLAPGGFGPEINGEVLREFAGATCRDAVAGALRKMMAPGVEPARPELDQLVSERRDEALSRELRAIAEMISGDNKQGEIPRHMLATIACPVRILWGSEDPILPVAQCRDLPAHFEVHVVSGAGHMLVYEAPDMVAEALIASIGGRHPAEIA